MAQRHGVKRYRRVVLGIVTALILFLFVPVIFFQIYFSLHQWTAYLGEWWQADFVGLEIFGDLLQQSRFYWALARSLIFASASTCLSLLIGFALAYLMREPFRGRTLFYLIFITPMLMVPVAIGYIFEMLLVQKGPFNQLLSWLSGQQVQVAWLAEKLPAFLAIIGVEVWNWTPFVFIIMLAGLTSMPKEPIEAAKILGATPLQIFFHVELPFLRPVISLALILRFLEALGEYPKVWALTRGGPGSYTETMPVYLFITSWEHFNISKGAAMSYLVLVIVGGIVYLCIRILLREKRALETLYGR